MMSIKVKINNRKRKLEKIDNVIDKDVQSMFLPLNIFQNIILCSKYCIKDGVITLNTSLRNFISLLGTILLCALFTYRIYFLFVLNDTMYFSSYFDCIYYCFGFVMNSFINFVQTKNNIAFVLSFQSIHRFLNDKTSFKRFVIQSWAIIFIGLLIYILFFSCLMFRLHVPLFGIICFYSLFSFDFNIIYATRLLKMLEDKVILWNLRAVSFQAANKHDKVNSRKMFEAFVDVLQCDVIFKMCFQQFVSEINRVISLLHSDVPNRYLI